MHDIDRTQMEYSAGAPAFESQQFQFGQSTGGVLSEAEEIQLASELLGVTNEAELEQFLGALIGTAAKAIGPMLPQLLGGLTGEAEYEAESDQFLGGLFKKASQAVGQFVRSPTGQAIGGVLKGVAKKALPLAGGALGGFFGGPLGANIGSGLASAAGGALGLEAETLAQEDREFEGAKQFVRLAADTVKNAAAAPATANPRAVAQAAAVAAAKKLAPGLLGQISSVTGPAVMAGRGQSGRWIRRGTKIVVYGV